MGQLQNAGSHDIDLFCHMPAFQLLFVAQFGHNPPTLQTDGQTDVILVAHARHAICRAKNGCMSNRWHGISN